MASSPECSRSTGATTAPTSEEPPANKRFPDRSLGTARRANLIASGALVATLLSTLFSCQQASEARRANDALQAVQARSVYVDVAPNQPRGQSKLFIWNRNREPINRVYYRYTVGD